MCGFFKSKTESSLEAAIRNGKWEVVPNLAVLCKDLSILERSLHYLAQNKTSTESAHSGASVGIAYYTLLNSTPKKSCFDFGFKSFTPIVKFAEAQMSMKWHTLTLLFTQAKEKNIRIDEYSVNEVIRLASYSVLGDAEEASKKAVQLLQWMESLKHPSP